MADLAENEMKLGLFCLPCRRWSEIDPARWIADGRPNVNYVEQKFVCRECGGPAQKQVRSHNIGMGASYYSSDAPNPT